MYFSCDTLNNQHKPMYERMQDAIERIAMREKFYTILYKLCYIATRLGIKLIIENPATIPSYLLYLQNFFKPTLIDGNRQIRGDYFKKPTAYWFFGFLPTVGCTRYNNPRRLTIIDSKSAPKAGLCSEERSLIAPEYAHNFICDFILGLANDGSDQQSFDFGE